MINIIISIDYEIFGNGKGNIADHIIKPTKKILKILNKYNIPLTIMMEIYEYIFFEKYDEQLKKHLGYSPVKGIKKQINEAYKMGHDIQLHIHPQFSSMTLQNDIIKITDMSLSSEKMSERENYDLIRLGKKKIESIITSSNYQCIALRLSNMPWIEAPKHVLKPMEKLGLKIHSLSASESKSDKGFWKIKKSNIYEIPIHTMPIDFLYLFTCRKIFTTLYIWMHSFNYPKIHSFFQTDKNDYDKRDNRFKWDFSKLSWKEMIEYLDYAMEIYDYENNEIPLVMIGHTKDFFNEYNLDKFIRYTKKHYVDKKIARFSTFQEFATNNL